MSFINAKDNPNIISSVDVQHNVKPAAFESDLKKLFSLTLSQVYINDEAAQQDLNEIKQLGRGYVNAMIAFNNNRIKANAKNIINITGAIKVKLTKVQNDYPEEPAFTRTSQRPVAQSEKDIKGVEHAGIILNSLFATFTASTFYPEYIKFYRELERESGREGATVSELGERVSP